MKSAGLALGMQCIVSKERLMLLLLSKQGPVSSHSLLFGHESNCTNVRLLQEQLETDSEFGRT